MGNVYRLNKDEIEIDVDSNYIVLAVRLLYRFADLEWIRASVTSV